MMINHPVLLAGFLIAFTTWLFAPMRVRLAFLAAAFRIVWRAWRVERMVAWNMKVGPECGGFEILFGVCVIADNIRAWTPKHGDAFKEKIEHSELRNPVADCKSCRQGSRHEKHLA